MAFLGSLVGRSNLSITKEELDWQVKNYDTLDIFHSARGISFLIVLFLVAFNFARVFLGFAELGNIIFASVLPLVVSFFAYRGHKWAMIFLIIIWALNVTVLPIMYGGWLHRLVLGALLIRFFYKPLKVEYAREAKLKTLI